MNGGGMVTRDLWILLVAVAVVTALSFACYIVPRRYPGTKLARFFSVGGAGHGGSRGWERALQSIF